MCGRERPDAGGCAEYVPSARRERTEEFINRVEDVGVIYLHHDIPNRRVRYKALGGKPIMEEDYSAD